MVVTDLLFQLRPGFIVLYIGCKLIDLTLKLIS